MINGTAPADAPSPAPVPDKRGPAVASADDPPSPASDQFSVSALGYTTH
jgi:hypothetical protein